MKNIQQNVWMLMIALAGMIFYWINKIDSPFQRIFGILIVASLSYWVGRLHGKILGSGADGKDPLMGPSYLYLNEKR